MRKSKRWLAMLLTLVMIVSCLAVPAWAAPGDASSGDAAVSPIKAVSDKQNGVSYVEGSTLEDLNKDVTIMVRMEGQTVYQQTGDLKKAIAGADSQQAAVEKAERRIEADLDAAIEVEHSYGLLFNGFSFTGKAWMIDAINAMDGFSAFEAPVFELAEPESSDTSVVNPSMATSTGLTGATDAWDLGYTGKGMTIAVIDTGILSTHEAFSVMPEGGKIDKAYLTDVYAKYGEYMHAGTAEDIDDIYYSAKLPFEWDYFDNDAIPNHTASDHGTHVAGIAAGNNGADFKGVAPDAQVVVMQVFQDTGGAPFDLIICAMEDCVYLGVDAINMSLGSAAGHTSYESVMPELEAVYDALENAGVSVCVAAGNDAHSSVWTNYGDWFYSQYRWLAANPDNGLVGSPATLIGSFGVASVQNTSVEGGGYLVAYGKEYYPATIGGVPSLGELEGGEYDIVYVGLGSPEEIAAAGGVEGKIALAKRGTLTFSAKCENAAAAGAAGVIIFNNAPGAFNPSVSSTIPFGAMSGDDGAAIIANFADGVNGKVTVVNQFAYGSVSMASSSSWGTTADLRITPEIAAPGDNITSAIGFGDDASYATWSGTSMATPHISGGIVLVKERLRETFPEASAAEINDLAYAFLMSTAHKVNGFVRQQGAGLMDIDAALTTDAYLTVPGANRPKLELDDSEDGSFTFSFEVNNIGDTDKTYTIIPSVMTESVADLAYSGNVMVDSDYAAETDFFISNPEMTIVKTINGTIKDVTDLCDITAPETVTVPAGKTVTVTMTIACSEELMAYFKENCPSGMYLEGFIKLADQAQDGIDLSVPFLGFVGDWDYPSMLDRGYYWQRPFGENNYAQLTTTQGSYIGYGTLEQGLGLNFYADMTGETYLADRNAISPNGDGLLDAVDYIEFALLRNPKTVKLYVQDAEGNVVDTFYDGTYTFRKEYWTGSFNGGVTYSAFVFDYVADELEENETAYIVLETWLDHEEYDPADNESGRWIVPVTKDLTAPTVKAVEGGVEIADANYTAYYAVYADEDCTELVDEKGVFADERGVAETYETELETYYVAVADYARNEAFYKVEAGVVTKLDKDAFGHSEKTIVAQEHINYEEGVYQYGWHSFNPETPNVLTALTELSYEMPFNAAENYGYDALSAAIAVDGTLYVNDINSLYTMDPETFERTKVADFWCEYTENITARNIMENPETYDIYAYVYMYGEDFYGTFFCELDTATGELTPLWEFNEDYFTYWSWAVTFMDADTLIVLDHRIPSICLLSASDGELLAKYDMGLHEPKYGTTQVGSAGFAGDLLYDPDENCVYYSSDWSWFRADRYGTSGIVTFDFDTLETSLHTAGVGGGLVLYAMYFADDVKPADFYAVMTLIDAIGEVTLDSGEAIDAARAAYDALSPEDKAKVENYQTLLEAEHAYVILKAEAASFTAASYYAKMILRDLQAKDVSGYSDHQKSDYAAALEAFEAAIKAATTSEEIAAALDVLYTELERIEASCPAAAYKDVDLSTWYHEYVDYALATGLMNGVAGGKFDPDGTTTRAQFVTVLYRAAGEPSVEGLENNFTDVADGIWYTDAVVWANANGIALGADTNVFAPDAFVTREQVVTFLYRYAKYIGADVTSGGKDALKDYADVEQIKDYAVDAMAWAVDSGIVNGVEGNRLAPQELSTRAQIAAIFMRFLAE